jgi:hypothetical protein
MQKMDPWRASLSHACVRLVRVQNCRHISRPSSPFARTLLRSRCIPISPGMSSYDTVIFRFAGMFAASASIRFLPACNRCCTDVAIFRSDLRSYSYPRCPSLPYFPMYVLFAGSKPLACGTAGMHANKYCRFLSNNMSHACCHAKHEFMDRFWASLSHCMYGKKGWIDGGNSLKQTSGHPGAGNSS